MKCRVIALYLPQFHPTHENDLWWGKGFTEWTNVAKARPLFSGHYQPRIPEELGFYDLRLPETRIAQANLAREYGIEGFCYWHYWFGNGRRLLERPFEEVLRSGKPDFPFCLSWANHSWKKKLWNPDGVGDKLLIEQLYPGDEDIIHHFNTVLPAFRDQRYIRVNGLPFFGVYAPNDHPHISHFIEVWQQLAKSNGLPGIYFVGHGKISDREAILDNGFNAFNDISLFEFFAKKRWIVKTLSKIRARLLKWPITIDYRDAMKHWLHEESMNLDTIPTIIPGWDHTPRSGVKGIILTHTTPKEFGKHVKEAVDLVKNKPEEERIIILKSWNEWGEGNYIEPDIKFGRQYLEELSRYIK